MKNTTAFFGIIALVAVIGFSMVGCPNEPDPKPAANGSAHTHQW